MEEKELNDNLKYYELFRVVPDTAKKKIQGGKLKGFTDINPMWRIKKLTEVFGICGIGWKAPIKEVREIKGAYDEIVVSMRIELQVCVEGCWSDPIEGIGGSMLVNTEKGDLVTNDEAYKMAYTDALSVACKMIGIGADVYYEKDSTKYTEGEDEEKPKSKYQSIKEKCKEKNVSIESVEEYIRGQVGDVRINDLSDEQFKKIMSMLEKQGEKQANS